MIDPGWRFIIHNQAQAGEKRQKVQQHPLRGYLRQGVLTRYVYEANLFSVEPVNQSMSSLLQGTLFKTDSLSTALVIAFHWEVF